MCWWPWVEPFAFWQSTHTLHQVVSNWWLVCSYSAPTLLFCPPLTLSRKLQFFLQLSELKFVHPHERIRMCSCMLGQRPGLGRGSWASSVGVLCSTAKLVSACSSCKSDFSCSWHQTAGLIIVKSSGTHTLNCFLTLPSRWLTPQPHNKKKQKQKKDYGKQFSCLCFGHL